MKYTNICTVGISVDITDNYTIVALGNYDKNSQKYNADFYLKRKDTDFLQYRIDDIGEISVMADRNNIKIKLLRLIEEHLISGMYMKAIQDYEYLLKCFDTGNNILEK